MKEKGETYQRNLNCNNKSEWTKLKGMLKNKK